MDSKTRIVTTAILVEQSILMEDMGKRLRHPMMLQSDLIANYIEILGTITNTLENVHIMLLGDQFGDDINNSTHKES